MFTCKGTREARMQFHERLLLVANGPHQFPGPFAFADPDQTGATAPLATSARTRNPRPTR